MVNYRKGVIMKIIDKCNSYMLDYFGYNWTQFNKLLKFFNRFSHFKFKWRLFGVCILIYLLPKFILFKFRLYLYIKPKWLIEGLKNKYIKRKSYGYQGYETYSEYDRERQIDWGSDMYK